MKIVSTKGVIPFRPTVLACAILACTTQVHAFQIDTGDSELKLRWDNTVKYTTAFRLKDQSPGLNTSHDDNQDDGDQNFDKGLISNRVDLLTEFDGSYKNLGFRVSGAAWYDDVYHQDTDNDSGTSNHTPASEFSDETKEVMGGDTDLLDAFVYGRFDFNEGTATVRLGRHTLLWGESLFYGANGIAGGMAPINVVKLQSVPNTTFKDAALPIGKLSVDLPLNDLVSVSGYVGYEYEKTQLPPAGSYFSASDALEGERIVVGGPLGFERDADMEPSDYGQYGLNVRWYDEDLDSDFGLYAIRYHAFTPSQNNLRANPPSGPGAPDFDSYSWAYHEGIRAFGASIATSIDNWSVAGEISYRENQPLASGPNALTVNPVPGYYTFNNTDNPGYAVGRTAHAQVSWIASLDPNFISDETSFIGEIAWNTRIGVDKNEYLLNPFSDRSAVGIKMVFTPTYRQLFSGVDISVPVGVSYTHGKSSALGNSFGVDRGGDFNIGVNALVLNEWKINAKYVTYYGPEGGTLIDAPNPSGTDQPTVSYRQNLADRDFFSLSISTTF
ncbi:DUF1302 domain-containing protein [Amphritea sp.]|uniref:DUF1302 domain-containing protein n=1 Tax=Amphritea sp. TaxID=1872502 RepID=UPI003A914E8B